MASVRRSARIVLATVLVLLLAALPAAHALSPSPLSLTLTGAIDNSGDQAYSQSGANLGCSFCFGEIEGTYVASTTTFKATVSATTTGTATTGTAMLSISGELLGGTRFSVSETSPIDISDSIAGEAFPITCTAPTYVPTYPLQSACTSEIPAFFLGAGTFDISIGGSSSPPVPLGMELESAFVNPFGGPIIWSSTDSTTSPTILLVFTYTSATVQWSNVQVSGSFSGTLGSSPSTTPVSGLFTETTHALEDLAGGTETEGGAVTFYDASPYGLDVTGTYIGRSTIPTTGEIDCSSLTGIPGTCTETGFSSSGTLTLDGVAVVLVYSLSWEVPALAFSGTAIGTAISSTGAIPGVPQFGSLGILPAALTLPLLFLLRKRSKHKAR